MPDSIAMTDPISKCMVWHGDLIVTVGIVIELKAIPWILFHYSHYQRMEHERGDAAQGIPQQNFEHYGRELAIELCQHFDG